jgi:hypothetical protein
MRVTIDQREALSAFGRIHFFVDCTVLFSESERAVIRTRQLGDHSIEVGGDVPYFRSSTGYALANTALWLTTWLTAISLLPLVPIIAIFHWNGGWWVLTLIVCFGSYGYRKYLERRQKRAYEMRHISLSNLIKNRKFTVYAPDAFYAAQTEASIVVQLNELKDRMIAIAPGLAEKQVYALEGA